MITGKTLCSEKSYFLCKKNCLREKHGFFKKNILVFFRDKIYFYTKQNVLVRKSSVLKKLFFCEKSSTFINKLCVDTTFTFAYANF